MPKSKSAGRPKLPKGKTKSEILRIRVTRSDLRAFDAAAKRSKQNRSAWIRSALKKQVAEPIK